MSSLEHFVHEQIDAIWQVYPVHLTIPGMGCSQYLDLSSVENTGNLVLSKIDPLEVKIQDRVSALDYLDAPSDMFIVESSDEIEAFNPNSDSIHPMIDRRPAALDGIDEATIIYEVTKLRHYGHFEIRQVIFSWKDSSSNANGAAGVWVAEGGPKPTHLRMYPELLLRHANILKPLIETTL